MPNVVTHGLMALDVYNQLPPSTIKTAIKAHPKAYLLGSNGPDILFYYNVFPWQDQTLNKKVADYGNHVHSYKVDAFYNEAVSFINRLPDGKRKTILTAYLAGHLMHWSLDSTAHPFVFYRSGEIAGDTRFWHYRYESMLDSLMVLYVKRRKMTSLHATRFVDVSDDERRIIASFYSVMLERVFDIREDSEVIDSAIESMKKILVYLYDPRNIKLPLIKEYEKRFGEPWAFSSHLVSSDIDAKYDVLNLKHETWCNPTNAEDISTQSFVDLYNESIDLGIDGLSVLQELFDGSRHTIDSFTQGKCYDTGRLEGVPMKFYDSIYDK
ncbi:zinc dependent phospholipase C family protein [Erysipelothrix larvae]|nr:zinc dependent phospholipase C family protein [Erysipelothrix larvae]